jgi:hypothetical protein
MTSTEAPEAVLDDGPPASTAVHSGRRLAAAVETALIVAGLAIFGFVLPHYVIADAAVRYDNLITLLHGHIPPGRYSMIGPLFATPLLALATVVGHKGELVGLYNTTVFALGILALYLLLRGRLAAALLRRFLLVLVAGSMFAAHVVHWNSEVFTAMAVGVGLTAVAVRRLAPVGWGAVVLGVANTPAAVIGLVVVVGKRVIERRRLRYALVALAGVALIGAENWIRNGSPLSTGYDGNDRSFRTLMPYTGGNGFDYPFFFGLLSLCLSFGKGLLFFAPGLVLPVRRAMRRITIGEDVTLYRLYVASSPAVDSAPTIVARPRYPRLVPGQRRDDDDRREPCDGADRVAHHRRTAGQPGQHPAPPGRQAEAGQGGGQPDRHREDRMEVDPGREHRDQDQDRGVAQTLATAPHPQPAGAAPGAGLVSSHQNSSTAATIAASPTRMLAGLADSPVSVSTIRISPRYSGNQPLLPHQLPP